MALIHGLNNSNLLIQINTEDFLKFKEDYIMYKYAIFMDKNDVQGEKTHCLLALSCSLSALTNFIKNGQKRKGVIHTMDLVEPHYDINHDVITVTHTLGEKRVTNRVHILSI